MVVHQEMKPFVDGVGGKIPYPKVAVWVASVLLLVYFGFGDGLSPLVSAFTSMGSLEGDGLYPIAMLVLALLLVRERVAFVDVGRVPALCAGVLLVLFSLLLPRVLPGYPAEVVAVVLLAYGVLVLVLPSASRAIVDMLGFASAAVVTAQLSGLSVADSAPFSAALSSVMASLRMPVTFNGLSFQVVGLRGSVVFSINGACLGFAAIGILALFVPLLANRSAVGFLKVLAVGALFLEALNVVRILVLVLVSYYYGTDGFLQAHSITGYVIFGGFYLVLALVSSGRRPVAPEGLANGNEAVTGMFYENS